MPGVAKVVYRLLERGRAGDRARREWRGLRSERQSLVWVRLDRELAGGGLGEFFRLGTRFKYRHPVDEALGGALRGRSPRTREGRIGPTAQKSEERGLRRENDLRLAP